MENLLEARPLEILAEKKEGREWEVVIIRAGESLNGTYYDAEILKESAGLFEDKKVYAFKLGGKYDHLPPQIQKAVPQGFAGDIVGWLESVRFGKFLENGQEREGLLATFKITENALWLRQLLRDSFLEGKQLLGFSINAEGEARYERVNGKTVKRVKEIRSVESVDLVTEPAAGGQIMKLVASTTLQEQSRLGDRLKELQEEKDISDDQLADAMGISRSTLDGIQSGDIEAPPESRLRSAAKLLGVSFESLDNLVPEQAQERQREAMAKTPIGMLETIQKSFPHWLEGFETENVSEDDAPDLLCQIVEANVARANDELSEIDDQKSERFQEVASGVAALQSIVKFLSGQKFEEAMKLISNWVAVYPRVEGEAKTGTSGFYSFPHGDDKSKRSESATLRPYVENKHKEKTRESEQSSKETEDMDEQRLKELENRLAVSEAKATLAEALSKSDLPGAAQTRVRKIFEDKAPTVEEIQEAIIEEKNYLASLSESGRLTGFGASKEDEARVNEDQREKQVKAMDAMIAGDWLVDGVRAYAGLHESFRKITGFNGSPYELAKKMMAGMVFCMPGTPGHEEEFEDHHNLLRESFGSFSTAFRETLQTTDWTQIFGDSIRRALMKEYGAPEFQTWRKVVSDVVPLADFRTNRRIRVGGFADLATVSETETFQEFSVTPDDEEEAYAPEKRGNLWSVSLEALTNDDLGKVRRIPQMLGVAAGRTLSKFVLNTLFTDNPTLDVDSVVLIATGHNNQTTSALSEATLISAIQQMKKQTELTSGERIVAIRPKLLVVPVDLEDTAWELIESAVKVTSNENATVPSVIRGRFRIEMVVNEWQTDVNNWFIVADPARFPTIEVGFLGGRQEPEVFIQDQPAIGSVFSADKITWKIRHMYGGTPLDFRTFAGGIVV